MLDFDDACPCGSTQRFGDCHGQRLMLLQHRGNAAQSVSAHRDVHDETIKAMREVVASVQRPSQTSDLLSSEASDTIDVLTTCIKRTTNRDLRRQACNLLRDVSAALTTDEEVDWSRIRARLQFLVAPNVWDHTAALLENAKKTRAVAGTPSAESRLRVALRRRVQWVDTAASADLEQDQRDALLTILGAFDDRCLAGELARVRISGGKCATFEATFESSAAHLNGEGSPYLTEAEQRWLNPSYLDVPSSGSIPPTQPDYEARLQRSTIAAKKLIESWILLTCALQQPAAIQHVRMIAESHFLQTVADGLQARRAPSETWR